MSTATRAREPETRGAGMTVDPRIGARRADVQRHEVRRRLRRAFVVAALVVLVGGGWTLLHSSVLSARVVSVTGSVHTTDAAIIAAAGLSDHPPLIDVSPGAAAAAIERLPWVARASVVRQWPDGVRISVVERTATDVVAEPAPAHGWALVDASGRVLARTPSRPAGLMQVGGPSPPGAPGTVVAGLRGALAVSRSLPAAFANQVSAVSEDKQTGITLHLTSPLTVYLGSTADLHAKYEDVAALLSGAPLAAGDVIDVSAPGAPVVRG